MNRLEFLKVVDELKDVSGFFQKVVFREFYYNIKIGKVWITFSFDEERLNRTFLYHDISKPDVVSQKLRKLLRGKRIREIYLKDDDRVVVFDFYDSKLFLDFIKKNIVFEGEESWNFKGVEINTKPIEFDESLNAGLMLGKVFGGKYVKDILSLGGYREKDTISSDEAFSLVKEFLRKSRAYWKKGEYRLSLEELEGYNKADSLSEAIDRALVTVRVVEEDKLDNIKVSILKSIEERKKEVEKMRRIADLIYEKYGAVEEIISKAREGKWDELKSKYKVYSINKKEKWVDVEL